jgi:hypothetical protein
MKLSHIALASSLCLAATFGGCGGSGTPLPAQQKVAKVTFLARTTAAKTTKGANRISDYTVTGFVVPANLSVPVVQGEKTIQANFINGYGNALMLGSYSTALTQPAAGKVTYSTIIADTSSDIGFGPVADLYLVLGDQNQTKSAITTLLTTGNPVMKGRAALCPAGVACGAPTKIDVFYNISVSVQTR